MVGNWPRPNSGGRYISLTRLNGDAPWYLYFSTDIKCYFNSSIKNSWLKTQITQNPHYLSTNRDYLWLITANMVKWTRCCVYSVIYYWFCYIYNIDCSTGGRRWWCSGQTVRHHKDLLIYSWKLSEHKQHLAVCHSECALLLHRHDCSLQMNVTSHSAVSEAVGQLLMMWLRLSRLFFPLGVRRDDIER